MQSSNKQALSPTDADVAVLAHRGTSLLAPENTLPAFEFACQHRADILELDVRLTRDRQLLVIHDDTVDRTTNGSGQIAAQNASALQRLDAAYRFDSAGGFPWRGRGVSLPLIDEILSRFPDQGVNIDVKDNSRMAVDVLAEVVGAHQAGGRVVVASFHRAVLRYCRARYPWLRTSACSADVKAFLWRHCTGAHLSSEMPVTLFQLPRRYFLIRFDSRWFIDAVHSAGGQIHFWTINEESIIRKLIEAGADGIVTDRADIAQRVVTEHRQRATAANLPVNQ